jgi:F-type H+-transporting ATPase subunit c
MTPETAVALGKALCVLQMAASGIGEAWVLTVGIKAIGRNPQLENTLFTKLIIGCAVVESTAIYALVAFFTF